MTAHKNRAGYVIVSWDCKQGRHGNECGADMRAAGVEDPIVCHCDCHPSCGRPECEKREPQRLVRNSQICLNCHEQLPLTGTCGNCE